MLVLKLVARPQTVQGGFDWHRSCLLLSCQPVARGPLPWLMLQSLAWKQGEKVCVCADVVCCAAAQDMLVKQIEGHTICALGDAGGRGWGVCLCDPAAAQHMQDASAERAQPAIWGRMQGVLGVVQGCVCRPEPQQACPINVDHFVECVTQLQEPIKCLQQSFPEHPTLLSCPLL